jgi:hypothetical protein
MLLQDEFEHETRLEWPDETKKEWIRIFGSEPPASQSW